MAWSIFKEGGGKGSAQAWAESLLRGINAPTTPGNVQVVYDWEVSEGSGGQYNPLNQGAVPGHPELTSTHGGGGVADYVSLQAGMQGAIDYLNMSNYGAIRKALQAGDSAGARSAIIASPWAGGHYNQGASFATEPLPGNDNALPGITNASFNVPNVGPNIGQGVASGFLDSVLSTLGISDAKDLAERLGLIVLGVVLILIGVVRATGTQKDIVRVSKALLTKGASETSGEEEKPKEEEESDADSESGTE